MNIQKFNPADWHNTRELDWIPDHFTVVPIDMSAIMLWTQDAITNNHVRAWILENTSGRYAFGNKYRSDEDVLDFTDEDGDDIRFDNGVFSVFSDSYSSSRIVGFENPSDATLFVLKYKSKNNNNPLF